MASTPPGWYDDGHGSSRWWDGTQWTTQVREWVPPEGMRAESGRPVGEDPHQVDAMLSPTPAVPRPAARGRVRGWLPALLIGVGAGVVTAVAILSLMLLGPMRDLVSPSAASPAQTGAPADRVHTDKEIAAARARVDAFAQAWWTSDCDAYFDSTTTGYREMIETDDCEEFYVASRSYRESNVTFFLETISTESIGDAIEVSVVEHYSSYYDEYGEEQEQPVDVEEDLDYLVVHVDGDWRVDNFFQRTN